MAGSEQAPTTRTEMSSRGRWLAALDLDPVDRLPFWPKLDGAYPRAQEPPFRDWSIAALHEWMGSDPQVGVPGVTRTVTSKTSREITRDGNVQTTIYRTPSGGAELVERFDEASNSWHPIRYPVRTADDIKVFTEYYADCRVELDEGRMQKARRRADELGQSGVISVSIGTSALMDWVQLLAGIENAHYMLMDHTREVEALFDAMHAVLLAQARIQCEFSPADLLYLVENTSTTLVSPEQYRVYWFPHVMECAEIARTHGRRLALHMCGHLKALLPDLAGLPVRAFEAFTSPSVGNTTLLDGRTACPDTCLIGGTNAALWRQPSEEITARIRQDLDALPHHRGIVVTSAGVMPPVCKPETIRAVCDWLKSYPART